MVGYIRRKMRVTALGLCAALALGPVAALWPAPANMTSGHEVLLIDQTLRVSYNGDLLSYTADFAPQAGDKFRSKEIIQAGVSRAFKAIFHQNFVPWKLRPRNSNFEPDLHADLRRIKSLEIHQSQTDKASTFSSKDGDVDESYKLAVNLDGTVKLECASSPGCLHGLESFVQLFFKHSSGTAWYTPHAPVCITDSPVYPHRGVLLDVARMWYDVDSIKRTLDAMSWNKMNRLHLHITDSQSWPLEIPALPELAAKGAYGRGYSYSPKDMADIFEYGIHRGVEVILEIDMPGHIGVVELAYKDLIVAYNEKPYQWWCNEPPCGAFRMNSSAVDSFVGKLFADLLPRVSPYSAYFHTGGDELNRNDSRLDPDVGSNETSVIAPLLQKFLNSTHERVRRAGLTPMCWEEMVTTWNMTLGSDVILQSWLGKGAIKKLAEAGHKVIDSDYNFWYLDCGRGQWLNFDNGVAFRTNYPFNDWCDPYKSWRLVYSHDPGAGVTGAARKLVLGGEVAVWSETTDPTILDSILWPRGSAAGEVLWSGRQDASGQNRSQLEAAPRLAELQERMVARGVGASPVQMIFCTQGNATECERTER